MCFLVLFCTACRLTPIEALPQTPQGLCPLTLQWVSPLAPGPFARFARCFILLHSCDLFGRLCTFLIPHSSLERCSICHTLLLSSPISPPKYHQAYQSFPISTSNLLPLLTVYSFWLYRQGKVYPAFVR